MSINSPGVEISAFDRLINARTFGGKELKYASIWGFSYFISITLIQFPRFLKNHAIGLLPRLPVSGILVSNKQEDLNMKKRLSAFFLAIVSLFLVFTMTGCTDANGTDFGSTIIVTTPDSGEDAAIAEDGAYTTKEDVALYLYTYGHLPDNFITKKEAQALGWEGGSLEPYAPGMCIGGSYFGNYEGLLPEKDGREYHECDIDTLGADSRGAKRIVYSNDGLIYYTEDHYESFELLYGEE